MPKLTAQRLLSIRTKLREIYLLLDEVDWCLGSDESETANKKRVREIMSAIQSLALHFQLLSAKG